MMRMPSLCSVSLLTSTNTAVSSNLSPTPHTPLACGKYKCGQTDLKYMIIIRYKSTKMKKTQLDFKAFCILSSYKWLFRCNYYLFQLIIQGIYIMKVQLTLKKKSKSNFAAVLVQTNQLHGYKDLQHWRKGYWDNGKKGCICCVASCRFSVLETDSLVVNWVFYPGEASSQEEAWLQSQPRRLITFSISTRTEDPFLCY